MRTVLFVHQSADLYGSDKVLLDIALGIRGYGFTPIVLVPTYGPLTARLMESRIETHVTDVGKLTRAASTIGGLLRLPIQILKAIRQIDQIVAGRSIDVVHSNTLAVLAGGFWAKWRHIPHIWHIHELIVSPSIARAGFPWLVKRMSDRVICNSRSTARWLLDAQPTLSSRTDVIWNGIEHLHASDSKTRPMTLDVVVTLVGRINRLKGQPLLVEAATQIWQRGVRHVKYLFVGSPPPGQEHYLERLKQLIAASPARDAIELRDFTEDIWSVWHECDIAVVPSIEPESFGLVAIEAMAAGKPVVAAAHGGLLDIVDDGRTGICIPPNDVEALTNALINLVGDPDSRVRYGLAGKARQREMFSLQRQIEQTARCYESLATST